MQCIASYEKRLSAVDLGQVLFRFSFRPDIIAQISFETRTCLRRHPAADSPHAVTIFQTPRRAKIAGPFKCLQTHIDARASERRRPDRSADKRRYRGQGQYGPYANGPLEERRYLGNLDV
jgi:hypothetical protein